METFLNVVAVSILLLISVPYYKKIHKYRKQVRAFRKQNEPRT